MCTHTSINNYSTHYMYYYIYFVKRCPTICILSNHHHRTFELSKSIIHTHVMIFSARTAHHVRIATHIMYASQRTLIASTFRHISPSCLPPTHCHTLPFSFPGIWPNGEQRQIGFHSISIAALTRRVRQKSVDEKSCTTFGGVIWRYIAGQRPTFRESL